jgi:hypothetical protein
MLTAALVLAVSPSSSPATTGSSALPSFWDRFVTSAGFGGLMAFLATCIAGGIALAQFRHVKRQQTQDRWWDTLTWVYDRTIVDEGNRKPLPQLVTFAMLSVLNSEAATPKKDRLRGETISSILGMFQPDQPKELTDPGQLSDAEDRDTKVDEREGSPTQLEVPKLPEPRRVHEQRRIREERQIAVEDSAAGKLFDSLLSDLRSQGYWDASMYATAVADALARVIGLPVTRPESQSGSYTPDFELHAREAYVMFEIRSTSGTILREHIRRWAQSVRRSPTFPSLTGALMISTQPLGRRERTYLENDLPTMMPAPRLRYARWASPSDDDDLAVALRSMGVATRPDNLR